MFGDLCLFSPLFVEIPDGENMLALETVQSVRTFTDERCHILTLDGVEVGRIGFGLDGVDLMIPFAVLDTDALHRR